MVQSGSCRLSEPVVGADVVPCGNCAHCLSAAFVQFVPSLLLCPATPVGRVGDRPGLPTP